MEGYEKEVDLPLVYLVLPYILYEPSRNFLKTANKKSSIYTLLVDKGRSSNTAGIEKRYDFFKDLTSEAIVVAHNEGLIEVDTKLKVLKEINYQKENDGNLREYYRAAYYLGKIFSMYRTVDIFLKTGVKKL